MRAKVQERRRAIELRRQGKSYAEIMALVPVAKGTLSEWLKDTPLSKKERLFLEGRTQILQDKGRLKVALQNHQRHHQRRQVQVTNAKIDFARFKKEPRFLIGLTLYWADGAQTGGYLSYTQSDPAKIRFLMDWMTSYLPIEGSDFKFRVYAPRQAASAHLETHWSRACTIPKSQFQTGIYQKATRRSKTDPNYKGSLRVIVPGMRNLVVVKAWQECLRDQLQTL